MMKVCMIYYTVHPNGTLLREAEALTERGDRVDIICLGKDKLGKLRYKDNLNIYVVQRRQFDEKGMMHYLWKYVGFFVSASFLTAFLYLRRSYKVIHVTSPPDFLVFASLVPRLLGAKVILDIHDIVPEFYMRKFNLRDEHPMIRLLKIIEKFSCWFSDHVLVVTHIWRDKLLKRSGIPQSKCTVLMNVPDDKIVSLVEKRKEVPSWKFSLLYPGSLSEHFGVEVLIRAMPLLKQEVPLIKLDIYGHGPQQEYLQNLALSLKLKDTVNFHRPVPLQKLVLIMKEIDVGIVPTSDGVFAGEALSVKSLEFLAAGVPIVISRTEASQYYYDDSMVTFFEPGNPHDLARAVIELYKNPDKRKELVRNARKFNEQHHWAHHKWVYYRVIDDLCSNSAAK